MLAISAGLGGSDLRVFRADNSSAADIGILVYLKAGFGSFATRPMV
jgi:hypothetical protein